MEFSEGDFVDFSKITNPESDQEESEVIEEIMATDKDTHFESLPENSAAAQPVQPPVKKKPKTTNLPKGTTDRWGSVISRIEALYCNGYKMETGYDSSDSFIDDEGLLSVYFFTHILCSVILYLLVLLFRCISFCSFISYIFS